MIEQVLNRRFVFEQLEAVRDQLKLDVEGDGRRAAGQSPDGAEDLTPDDDAAALEFAESALVSEQSETSGQLGFDQPDEERRRGEAPPVLDDTSFFSRDPTVSNLQSALEEYIETREAESLERLETEDDGRRGGEQYETPAAAELTLQHFQGARDDDGRRLFNKFSVADVRWVSSLFSMGIRKFRGKHAFVQRPAEARPISDCARIILVGDWGSGIPRARKVADQMRLAIDDAKRQGKQVHVIHLGDVYYSGWEREYRNRFLEYWPVHADEATEITSWSTNANHDMYAGGHAYYNTLLGDTRFARQQKSSMFSLTTGNWRLLGLDTAWDDHELKEPQPKWVRDQVAEARQAGQKVMLLSHHQLFSSYESGGERLATALGDLLADGEPKINSWFWGHEHRCVLYKKHMNIPFARCVGHGGVPVYQWRDENDALPEPGEYEYRGRLRKGLEQWALFGFAVLDFEGPSIGVRYINENGDTHKQETIS